MLWIIIAYLYVIAALTIFSMSVNDAGPNFGKAVRAMTWPVVFPIIAVATLLSSI